VADDAVAADTDEVGVIGGTVGDSDVTRGTWQCLCDLEVRRPVSGGARLVLATGGREELVADGVRARTAAPCAHVADVIGQVVQLGRGERARDLPPRQLLGALHGCRRGRSGGVDPADGLLLDIARSRQPEDVLYSIDGVLA